MSMKEKNAKIFVISMNNITKRLDHYGDANINNINLLKLIYKYACYSKKYSYVQAMDKLVAQIQRTDPDICLERTAARAYSLSRTYADIDINNDDNNAPTITDVSVTINDSSSTIGSDELLAGYSDTEGTSASTLVIKTIPANGTLSYNDVNVVVGQNISLSDGDIKLEYTRNSEYAYSTSFTFTVYDGDSQLPLESNTATATVTVEASEANEAPTVGDANIYVDNRAVRVFTLADFTTNTNPEYSDPEGDSLDAIRIDSISESNQGEYLFYGTPVVVNQVISAEEIEAGAFTYEASDMDSIHTDILEVSVRDTGSLTWVS